MQSKEHVQQIADLLMPGFIPKDKSLNELSFHFTVPPNDNFKVWYEKKSDSNWQFVKYEQVER